MDWLGLSTGSSKIKKEGSTVRKKYFKIKNLLFVVGGILLILLLIFSFLFNKPQKEESKNVPTVSTKNNKKNVPTAGTDNKKKKEINRDKTQKEEKALSNQENQKNENVPTTGTEEREEKNSTNVANIEFKFSEEDDSALQNIVMKKEEELKKIIARTLLGNGINSETQEKVDAVIPLKNFKEEEGYIIFDAEIKSVDVPFIFYKDTQRIALRSDNTTPGRTNNFLETNEE